MGRKNDGPMDWYVSSTLEGAEERYEKIKAEYLESVAENPVYATEWKLAGMIEAQAMFEIAAEFDDVYDREALDRWAKRSSHALTMVRGESKSTSGASNLVEEIRQATKLNLLGKYYEAIDGEEHLARSETKNAEEIRQVGQAVQAKAHVDERAHTSMVDRVNEDGTVNLIVPTGQFSAGIALSVPTEKLRVTTTQPYRAVQLRWEQEVGDDLAVTEGE